MESLNFILLSVAQLCDLEFKYVLLIEDAKIKGMDCSNIIGFRHVNRYRVEFWC
jgi:hypothetical protein